MKKIILLFAILFLSAGVTSGQFAFGPKIGYNASKLHTSLDSIKSSFNSGFHFGAFVRIGKKVYFQPELYYTLQGGIFQNNVSNTYDNWKQNVTVGTLDIPLLVGFRLVNLDSHELEDHGRAHGVICREFKDHRCFTDRADN